MSGAMSRRKGAAEVGAQFGRLTVVALAPSRNRSRYVIAECECGNRKTIAAANLLSGRTNSCGCLSKHRVEKSVTCSDCNAEIKRRHSYRTTKKQRCTECAKRAYGPRLRAWNDRRLYNLLPHERQLLREAQGGVDPISGAPLVAAANVDHCHKTGLIRGLLNPITNKLLVDDQKRLRAMLNYIESPPAIKALGKVYGVMGRANKKAKNLRYGPPSAEFPRGRKVPHSREAA